MNKMLDHMPGLETMKLLEEMIEKGLELSSNFLREELLEEYDNMSEPLRCVVDCEGVSVICLGMMFEVLMKHKKIIEKVQQTGRPLREVVEIKPNPFRLVKDGNQIN